MESIENKNGVSNVQLAQVLEQVFKPQFVSQISSKEVLADTGSLVTSYIAATGDTTLSTIENLANRFLHSNQSLETFGMDTLIPVVSETLGYGKTISKMSLEEYQTFLENVEYRLKYNRLRTLVLPEEEIDNRKKNGYPEGTIYSGPIGRATFLEAMALPTSTVGIAVTNEPVILDMPYMWDIFECSLNTISREEMQQKYGRYSAIFYLSSQRKKMENATALRGEISSTTDRLETGLSRFTTRVILNSGFYGYTDVFSHHITNAIPGSSLSIARLTIPQNLKSVPVKKI